MYGKKQKQKIIDIIRQKNILKHTNQPNKEAIIRI